MKISTILQEMIRNDQQMEFYISNRLLNLSQFAKYIKPQIDTKMRKSVKQAAIVMALSRIQKREVLKKERVDFRIRQIKVHSDLCTMSFDKHPLVHKEIQELYAKAIKENVYFTISESSTEITFISKKEFIVKQTISTPKFKHMELSAVTIQFDSKYLSSPGVITTILQKLAFASINFIEISSTCTELTIYINYLDLKLAFNTLFDSFIKKSNF